MTSRSEIKITSWIEENTNGGGNKWSALVKRNDKWKRKEMISLNEKELPVKRNRNDQLKWKEMTRRSENKTDQLKCMQAKRNKHWKRKEMTIWCQTSWSEKKRALEAKRNDQLKWKKWLQWKEVTSWSENKWPVDVKNEPVGPKRNDQLKWRIIVTWSENKRPMKYNKKWPVGAEKNEQFEWKERPVKVKLNDQLK